MSDNDDGQELTHLMNQEVAPGGEAKSAIGPLGAAVAGLAGLMAGASVMVLWSPWTPEPLPTVSVSSCSERYEEAAGALIPMVGEGISAGQSPTTDVSWVNSIHDRLGAIEAQLEALGHECVDGPAEQ